MERVMIQLSSEIVKKLKSLKKEGYSVAGYIRTLVERDLRQKSHGKGQKGR